MDFILTIKKGKKLSIGKENPIRFKEGEEYPATTKDDRYIIAIGDRKIAISDKNKIKFFDHVNECIYCGKKFISDKFEMSCPDCTKSEAESYNNTFDQESAVKDAQDVIESYSEKLQAE